MKEFLSVEVSTKLKECGFNYPGYWVYNAGGLRNCLFPCKNSALNEGVSIAVRPSEAREWLIVEKGLVVETYTFFDASEDKWFFRYVVTNLKTHERNGEYEDFNTYNEAEIAGIKYTLNVL